VLLLRAHRALELQQRLEGLESSASNEHTTNLALASKLAGLESELRAAQAGLRTAEAAGRAAGAQLQVRGAGSQTAHYWQGSRWGVPLLCVLLWGSPGRGLGAPPSCSIVSRDGKIGSDQNAKGAL